MTEEEYGELIRQMKFALRNFEQGPKDYEDCIVTPSGPRRLLKNQAPVVKEMAKHWNKALESIQNSRS